MAEYIEREKAKELVCEFCTWVGTSNCEECEHPVDDVPAADVQPVRHGRWDEESPDCLDGDSVYVCSVCGETWTLIEGTPLDNNMHYCPNCGAKMGEEEE